MLNGQGQVLLREVEHVEDDGLRASVFAVVDGVHHLDDGLALQHGGFSDWSCHNYAH